jgi:hypothetical protein
MRTAENLTTYMCRISINSGGLKLLGGLEPAQAYNGTAVTVALSTLQLALQIHSMKIVQRADELDALFWWFDPVSHICHYTLLFVLV